MFKKPVVLIAIASLAVSACASAPPSQSARSDSTSVEYTPEETRFREDRDNFAMTVVEGAVVGAAVGSLMGGIIGGSWSSAAIGAGAGAVAGGLTGAYVASKQREYADAEARTDSMIADVRQDNEKLAAYIATTREVIDNDRRRLATLNAQYAANQLDAGQAKAQLARIRDNRRVIAETADSLRDRRDAYVEASVVTERESSAQDVAELNREITILNRNIEQLEAELSSLDSALAVSPIA